MSNSTIHYSENRYSTGLPCTVDATSSQSQVLAWVTSQSGTELYDAKDIPDNTATAITTAVNGQRIGDSIFVRESTVLVSK